MPLLTELKNISTIVLQICRAYGAEVNRRDYGRLRQLIDVLNGL